MDNRILLGVNIDHVATLREARGTTRYPEPIQAAIAAEEAGADGITIHLREDRRHIQQRDVELLNEVLQTRMNLEMAVTKDMLALAEKIRPATCCFVPERREELTTEGGLDVVAQEAKIRDACAQLRTAGIAVSLFIDPDKKQIDAAIRCAAPMIEIHTGHYADATTPAAQMIELQRIELMAQYAKKAGLQVNAGHGLHYHNVHDIAAISELTELNIGHSIIARALFVGLKAAVAEMKALMLQARD